jgi:predicted nucleic acid-binding protein
MILCDTAPLFCSVDKSQPRHQAVKIFIENKSSYLITTWACFTESMYLCLKRGGWSMQAQLGKLLLGLRHFRAAKKAQTITGQRVNLDL